ncbi:MAG: required for meiotic nuclear division protein 1 [Mucilaginibacter sp.]|nr:required for meiotic nuclear division protein 1 [Mucilaginibacter sp.]
MLQQVLSYQIADSIDIKMFKSAFKADLYFNDTDELFYIIDEGQYIYVFKYGVVCFLNYDAIKISEFLRLISSYCKNKFDQSLEEEFKIQTNSVKNKIGFHSIEIIGEDIEVLRLIMLTVSQSVALDYYHKQTTKLLEETNYHTQILETKGRLDISGINLKKYIGRTLLLKNRIAENLYIFDSPPETWEDENLNKIHNDLKRTFDLKERFRNIQEGLNIVKDNYELFRDLLQYRNSYRLELVIILLILVEVLNIFAQKIFN